MSSTIEIVGDQGGTVEESLSSAEAITMTRFGDTNTYFHSFGTEWWNPVAMLMLNGEFGLWVGTTYSDPNRAPVGRAPAAHGEYYVFEGTAGQPSQVWMYSDVADPHVVVGMAQKPALKLVECVGTTVRASALFAGYAIQLVDCVDVTIEAPHIVYCGMGVVDKRGMGTYVYDGNFENIGSVPVRLNRSQNSWVENNTFREASQSDTISGGTYFAKSIGCRSIGNSSYDAPYGRSQWEYDGAGIVHFESGSEHNTSINDTCYRSEGPAILDNSGGPNSSIGLTAVDCYCALKQGDSKGVGNSQSKESVLRNPVLQNTPQYWGDAS